MTEPTDNDLDVLLAEHWPAFATSGARPLQGMRAAMRDAIAKWGKPQTAPDCHHRPPCDECAALAAQGATP